MQIKNDSMRYGAIAQLFHWLIVALIITQVTLVKLADDLPLGVAKIAMLARHKSVGITILGLVLLRLIWRWANPVPAIPASTPGWQQRTAHITHVLLYVLLLITPVFGWFMSSARNFPVSWFGIVTLPDFVQPNQQAYDFFHQGHEVLAISLLVVALLHTAAALKHHFVDRDNVLRRMLPVRLKGE